MRMNLHHLYIFWTLAKVGNFTEAAKKLSIAQSAVTLQIKKLEEALELSLIDRTNKRKISLTEEGVKVLEFADSIFELSEDLVAWAQKGEYSKKHVIRIGALSGLSRNLQFEFLKPLLTNERVKFEITTGDKSKLLGLLKEHNLDLILSSQNIHADEKVNYYSHVLGKTPIVFVIAKKFAHKGYKLNDYLNKRMIYIPGKGFDLRSELDAFFDRLKIVPKIKGEIDDVALLRILALRTSDIVALPLLGVKNDLEEGTLKIVGNAGLAEQRFYAITRMRRYPSALIQELIEAGKIKTK